MAEKGKVLKPGHFNFCGGGVGVRPSDLTLWMMGEGEGFLP